MSHSTFWRSNAAFGVAVRLLRVPLAASVGFFLCSCASLDAMKRVEVNFDYVSELARELADQRYRAPEPVPEFLMEFDYDAYRKIRYDSTKAMWKDEGLPFALGFFHPGFLYGDRVKVNEFTPTHAQQVRFLKTFFEYDDQELREALPSSLDYAGFRVSYAVDKRHDFREVASFLGANYFRGVGVDSRFGTSARGIAIDSGLGKKEEFPNFTEVWLGKPLGNAEELVVYALLDGPSVTGAYRFIIRPGESTVMDVRARVFMRESVESFGIAPLTSMYWRGENRKSPESDYRPEVHDADGLIVAERDEDPIWRALDLGERTRLSYLSAEQLTGFGLMQRDRDFSSYQDLEAEYHRRPSVWIEAKGDWGRGLVKLVELPAENEFEDNIIAFWEPAVLPEKGSSLDFEYTIHWTPEGAPRMYPESKVIATRVGEDLSYPGSQLFVIDFSADGAPENRPELVAAAQGEAEIVDQQVLWNPYLEAWRVVLRVEALQPEVEGGAIELRSQLLFGEGKVSEVWAYQWTR